MSKTIEIDFSSVMLDFLEEPIFADDPNSKGKPTATMASCLSKFILSNSTDKESLLKLIVWAGDLRETKKLSLDKEEFNTLLNIVRESPASAVIKSQLYQKMIDAKDASEKGD